MPSSQTLAYRMHEAHNANSPQMAREAFREWQACHCTSPVRVYSYDAHTQTKRYIEVPCGKCLHCRQTHINEWVTRMYAHLHDFKHVYFITLTYRSFTDDFPAQRVMMQKLSQAVWHKDSFNQTHHHCYRPCLLWKKHYQDFLKRLRKNTGLTDISYVLSGEYGKRYGAPHFHAILFSNGEITRQDIVKAWSIALWCNNLGEFSFRTNQRANGVSYDIPIGRVDYHDLVTNGTLNTTAKVKIDGQVFSARECFAYVCKYVCKAESPNKRRIALAYNGMFHRAAFTRLFKGDYAHALALNYLHQNNMRIIADGFCYYKHYTHKITYEKITQYLSPNIFGDYLRRHQKINVGLSNFLVPLYADNYYEFAQDFAPFVEFSRGTPIGSIYAKTHIQEFAQGIFAKPLLQDSGYVLPRYFVTKAQEYLYGFRRVRKTLWSTSSSLGPLVDLYGFLSCGSPSNCSYFSFISRFDTFQDYDTLLRKSNYRIRDLRTGESILVFPLFALRFKYDRHMRKYIQTSQQNIRDFMRDWLISLQLEFERYRDKFQRAKESKRLQEISELLATDLGLDWKQLRLDFAAQQQKEYDERQLFYNEVHHTAE